MNNHTFFITKADIECVVKQFTMCLEYQQTQPKKKCYIMKYHDDHGKYVVLCIAHYYSKLPIVKKVNSLSKADLVQMTKLIFAEHGLLKKIVSDVGSNFTAETFKDFCRKMNVQQTITSSYHQSNGQVELCIKFV